MEKKESCSVLVADDNTDYRRLLNSLFTTHSYQVLEAGDGEEALKLAASCHPDLIIADFDMPLMNGYELIQAVRGDASLRKTPMIMLTGSSKRRYLKELGVDVSCFLEKPVSNNLLLESVAKAIRKDPEMKVEIPAVEEPKALPAEDPSPDWLQNGGTLETTDAEEERRKQEQESSQMDAVTSNSPLVKRVNQILIHAVEIGASDIHIEPQEENVVVRVRLDGTLSNLCTLPLALQPKISARIKIMANLIVTERRLPQDGHIAAMVRGQKIEFRVSTLPCNRGEKIVLRILGRSKLKGSLDSLGLNTRDRGCIESAIKTPHGLILATGPTGSGKTTTLYTMISVLNKPEVNIMTAEDPVEYELPGISQVQIKSAIGLTFESVLRAFLRQDPDIMLVGEIRDLETAEMAVKASITGHLVLSTLHTNSAPATITRLVHMGIAPFLVAASVKLVIAQRLVKLLCPFCKLAAPAPLSELDKNILAKEERDMLQNIYINVGCSKCNKTGFAGRKALIEVMPIQTSEMRQLIQKSSNADVLTELAVAEGMTTLRKAALQMVAEGLTSLPEAYKVILGE